MELFRVDGQVALVTGAGRGLGLEVASLLARAGASVWVAGRSPELLNLAVERIRQEGGDVQAIAFDVADDRQAADAMAAIRAGGRRLDILVNNVGQRDRRALSELDIASVRRLIDVNLVSAFRMSQLAATAMIEHGRGGRIINVSSIAGPIARAGDAAYTTAKAGLDGLTRALAAELGVHAITVNSVAPGYFKTPMNADAASDPAIEAWLGVRTSLGRWGDPAELAPAVLFLASPAGSYVTGHVLSVDGGYLAHF